MQKTVIILTIGGSKGALGTRAPPFLSNFFYYRPQRSWTKVMFLQASVILSTGGGCLPQCMLGCQTPPDQAHTPGPGTHPRGPGTPPPLDQAHTPPHTTPKTRHTTTPDQAHHHHPPPPPPGPSTPPSPHGPGTPRTRHPSPGSRRQHTVNERPVRILLECILVFMQFSGKNSQLIVFHTYLWNWQPASPPVWEILYPILLTQSRGIGFFTNSPQYKNANIANFHSVPSERNCTNEVCNLEM